jgi:hypothetical protein
LLEELDIGTTTTNDRHRVPTFNRLDPVGVGPKKISIEPSWFLTVFSKPFFDGINFGVSGVVPSAML